MIWIVDSALAEHCPIFSFAHMQLIVCLMDFVALSWGGCKKGGKKVQENPSWGFSDDQNSKALLTQILIELF